MQFFLSNASQIQGILHEIDVLIANLAPLTISSLFEYAILHALDELHKSKITQ